MPSSEDVKRLAWTDAHIASFWDYESRHPEHYFTFQYGASIARKIRRFTKNRRTLLDFGCGAGFMIPHLIDLGLEVTGTDLSRQSVVATAARFAGRRGFSGAFPLDDVLRRGNTFDAILAAEVIEHLNDTHLDAAMASIKKLMGPDGIVIITTRNREDLGAEEVFCPQCRHVFHRWQHLRSWSAQSLSEFLVGRGFVPIVMFETDFSLSPAQGLIRYVLRRIRRAFGSRRQLPHLACVCRAGTP